MPDPFFLHSTLNWNFLTTLLWNAWQLQKCNWETNSQKTTEVPFSTPVWRAWGDRGWQGVTSAGGHLWLRRRVLGSPWAYVCPLQGVLICYVTMWHWNQPCHHIHHLRMKPGLYTRICRWGSPSLFVWEHCSSLAFARLSFTDFYLWFLGSDPSPPRHVPFIFYYDDFFLVWKHFLRMAMCLLNYTSCCFPSNTSRIRKSTEKSTIWTKTQAPT